ncbi:G-type lectin S-receptor-like serine/threonine-protein kinase [Hibiscus syriacus]|uniref:G-type lectin S-receptor-like serine/threonine-protein kinase n=1 Tax=Hibiscus syriacus TaxID=106335 RepID=A0A6A3BGB7_HIBSY|nr:G-type lectin S-receptor-like serine/threonine-protein kinase [Hibiscus syriacus]
MENFHSMLSNCALDDLGYSGRWYTWERGRSEGTNIRERLDRGVANSSWWDLFPDFRFASNRRRTKRISTQTNEAGVILESDDEIQNIARDYFCELFESKGVSDPASILMGVTSCINEDTNRDLMQEYSYEEISAVVRSMSPLKASGEDGLGAVFYQRFWKILGPDIAYYCAEVLQGWQHLSSRKGIHWCTWKALCVPKEYGGMGFRDLGKFNIALLASQGWRLLTNPGSLMMRTLHAKYYPNATFDKALLGWCPTTFVPVVSSIVNSFEFVDWIDWLFQRTAGLVTTKLWAIWNARNKMLYENSIQRVEDVVTFIRSYVGEIDTISHRLRHPLVYPNSSWRPPAEPNAKINVNASYNSSNATSSLSVIQGLGFALDPGLNKIELEGDSRAVIQKINSHSEDFSVIRPFTSDARAMASHFQFCTFNFAPRNCNLAVHALCREGMRIKEDRYWIEDAPGDVSLVVNDD